MSADKTSAIRSAYAEQELVAVLLQDNSLLNTIDLQVDWFASPLAARMVDGIKAMAANNRIADHVTLADHLGTEYPNINWMAEIIDLASNSVARAENAESYAAVLRDNYHTRSAERIAQQLLHNSKDGQAAVDAAISELMALSRDEHSHAYSTKEIISSALEKLEEAQERAESGQLVGIDSGLTELNEATGGWHNTDLVVIPARPAMGKTAILLNFLLNSDKPFGLISSEQAYDQIGLRMISIEGRVSGGKMRAGKLEGFDWDQVSLGAQQLMQRQMHINDNSGITIEGIKRQARTWVHQNNIEILGVDYIQRISPTDKRLPKHQQVEEVVMGLKSLAKELGIPIIALAQVNRQCEARENKRPQMGDIADASAIEKEADLIITLYRDEVYNPNTEHPGIAELGICKNRHGAVGNVFASWSGATFRIENLSTGGAQ